MSGAGSTEPPRSGGAGLAGAGRGLAWLLAFGSVLGLGAAGGGWSAVSWGWAALALSWAAGLALVLGPQRLSRLELGFAGGLLAIAAWMGASTLWTQSVPASVLEVERAVVYVAGVGAALLLARRGVEDGVLAAALLVCAWNLGSRLHGFDAQQPGADAAPIGYANGLGLIAAIGCILACRRLWTLPALAVFVPVLWLADSLGSWLGLAVGIVVALRPRLAPLAIVVAALAVALAVGAPRTHYWHVALEDARAHPALGSGAGTFHQVWIERRPVPHEAHDAHSLYLESLAELGPLGLLLVAGTLALPFARGRGAALGAYAVYVVQAGVDWEWELPAVTLAGLLCGAGALQNARRHSSVPSNSLLLGTKGRAAALVGVVAVAAFSLVGLAGNRALDRAADALRRGDSAAAAAEARSARRWAPWSAEPYRIESHARGGDPALLRRAVVRDAHDWSLWASLAAATSGPERRRAAAMAARLDPLGAGAPSG
jgi:hypothetical protein